MARYLAFVEIDGMVSVFAVRAVWTALTAVPGIRTADVTMTGATLELEAPVEESVLAEVLATAGVTLRSLRQIRANYNRAET